MKPRHWVFVGAVNVFLLVGIYSIVGSLPKTLLWFAVLYIFAISPLLFVLAITNIIDKAKAPARKRRFEAGKELVEAMNELFMTKLRDESIHIVAQCIPSDFDLKVENRFEDYRRWSAEILRISGQNIISPKILRNGHLEILKKKNLPI